MLEMWLSLSRMHEVLRSVSSAILCTPVVVAQAWSPGTWEVKAGRSENQDHPLLLREIEVTLSYLKCHLHKTENSVIQTEWC